MAVPIDTFPTGDTPGDQSTDFFTAEDFEPESPIDRPGSQITGFAAQGDPLNREPFQNIGDIAGSFSARLLERLNQPIDESQAFFFGSKAIREALAGESSESKQRLADLGAAGNIGPAVAQEGNIAIDRARAQAMSGAVRNLFLQLEDRRDQGALEFLSAYSGRQTELRAQDTAKRGQEFALGGKLGSAFIKFAAEGARQAATKCWVARAIYGENNPKWLMARYFITHLADPELHHLYLTYGEGLAETVKSDPELARTLKPEFDFMVDSAERFLMVRGN
jgi:hypothetical protein